MIKRDCARWLNGQVCYSYYLIELIDPSLLNKSILFMSF